MTAFGTLLRFRMRRDRIQVPVWVVVIALSCLGVTGAVAKTYGTHTLRVAALTEISANPALIALRGAPDGASAGAFFWVEIGGYLALLVAFMNSLLAVRHTRADEEAGRAELIVATGAGRWASSVATLVLAVIADALVGLFSSLAMLTAGFDPAGSLTVGWVLATTGIAFFAGGLLFAQIFGTSRAANSWGVALIGGSWVLAAAGNAGGTRSSEGLHVVPSGLVWVSPIGWALRAQPFTRNLLWPGLLSLAFGALLVLLAFALLTLRDTGAGLVSSRAGRERGSAALGGPIGLAWRLQRASIFGWGIGAIIGAALVAGLGKTLNDTARDNPQVAQVLRGIGNGTGSVLQIFLGVMMTLIGLLVAGAAIQTMMRLRQEEVGGTAELVLASRVTRLRWYLAYVLVALGASTVILALAGLVAGAALSGIEAGLFSQALTLALGQLPAVAVFLGVVALVFALVHSATVPGGWAIFGVGVLLGEFGPVFGFPHWLTEVAPTAHTAMAPIADADWSGSWVLSVIAVLLVLAAAWALRRRDVVTG